MISIASFDHHTFLKNLTTRPGVYRMLNAREQILYVGKTRNLKKRVSSYFRTHVLSPKTQALMAQVHKIEVTITQNENEALLLENNLIKNLKPHYNILLKDDKSYPYLFLSPHPDFPRLDIYRGARREKGEYYGPYPNVNAVYETLDLLQKLFKLRQCRDSFFKNRTRPCLQYQIKRCTAPCVDYIDTKDYQENVHHARLFLQGKNDEIIQALAERMEKASQQLAFEQAAHYRDQMINLRKIQASQYVDSKTGDRDVDIIAIESYKNSVCIEILFIRSGRLIGNKSYFPKLLLESEETEVLSSFLSQYYLSERRGESFPKHIYLNLSLSDQRWIQAALSEQWKHKIVISHPVRGQGRKWVEMALINAKHALASYVSSQNNYHQALEALQKALKFPNLPQYLECFDVSHTMGEAAVASCVVFGMDGPIKENYRRFNITNIVGGDDYAAMKQALTRHYSKIKLDGKTLPDVLIIDGGKGQLKKAEEVLEELQIREVRVIAIAKGPTRKPGLETIFISGHVQPISLPNDSIALHLLQRIRDEAHRFAITGHRSQRAKARTISRLEEISQIGAKRRRELLRHFGGLQGVLQASVDDLAKVQGISKELAKFLYDHLH